MDHLSQPETLRAAPILANALTVVGGQTPQQAARYTACTLREQPPNTPYSLLVVMFAHPIVQRDPADGD
jgi:hypothetical protein